MFLGMGFGGDRRGGNPLVMLGVVLLGAVGAAIIKAMISRSREYVADADGAAIAGRPDGLMSALQKLDALARRVPMQNPNPAMNNLFIVEPFMGRTLTNLFASHPPVESRLNALPPRPHGGLTAQPTASPQLDPPSGRGTMPHSALLAQLAEQLTLNQRVVGSSPTQGIPA